MNNPVKGIDNEQDAKTFLLERGIEAFQRQASYVPTKTSGDLPKAIIFQKRLDGKWDSIVYQESETDNPNLWIQITDYVEHFLVPEIDEYGSNYTLRKIIRRKIEALFKYFIQINQANQSKKDKLF